MKAAVITAAGGPDVLALRDVPTPEPGTNDIRVKVMAAGVNRADLLQREGKYPAPPGAPQNIPGLEFAGEVAALGPAAKRWRLGQRVFGIVAGGAHAQYVVTHEDAVAEIPLDISWSAAAAVPEVYITAHDAMWTQAALQSGESVLIHSVGSGVGVAAVHLARAKGAIPFGTSRTAEKLELAALQGMEAGLVLGADLAPLKTFAEQHTPAGFDVALDLVGGSYVAGTLPAMALKGRVMLIGTVAGTRAEINLGLALSRRLHLRGTVLRARTLAEKIAVTQAFAQEIVPLLAARQIVPVVDREFPLPDIAAAHQRLASNATFGKVVLLIPH